MSVEKKEEVVDRYGYCSNCLAKSHDLRGCVSMDTCRICDRFHHTLLHPGSPRARRPTGIRTSELRHRLHKRVLRERRRRQTSPRHHHRHQPRRTSAAAASSKRPMKPTKPLKTTTSNATTTTSSTPQPAPTAGPSTKAIVDAIRSLVNVLCPTETTTPIA